MSEVGSREIEMAEEMVTREAETGVARIRGSLAAAGLADCEDCGGPIEPLRRAALPSARRCADCQRQSETSKRRGW